MRAARPRAVDRAPGRLTGRVRLGPVAAALALAPALLAGAAGLLPRPAAAGPTTSPAAASRPATPTTEATSAVSKPAPEAVKLVSQSTWVRPGQTFSLEVAVTGPVPPSALEVGLSVYPRLGSRSGYDLTLHNEELGEPLLYPRLVPVTSVEVAPGRFRLTVTVEA
ncbi:MAG: hypothetical protein ACRDYD_13690, partial [Acidimicrobiales bacterium]